MFLLNIPATIIPTGAPDVDHRTFFLAHVPFGYSLDDISLWRLTLCVGFVVDYSYRDAGKISLHIEGKSPAPVDPRRVEGGRLYHPSIRFRSPPCSSRSLFMGGIPTAAATIRRHHYRRGLTRDSVSLTLTP